MSETPNHAQVREHKINGFGAFQQCAEFFLRECKLGLPPAEESAEFVTQMQTMHTVFDIRYRNPVIPELEKEGAAWEQLSPIIRRFLERFTTCIRERVIDAATFSTLAAYYESLGTHFNVL